jgi:drug/metabolite transporter (DMT)-like permease
VLPILLAVLSALVWGTGDFCGGKASQRSSVLAVTVVSQIAGLPVLAVCVALAGGAAPGFGTLGWGALAGLAGLGGILLLYQGLARGAMAIFAPITAVTAALVPIGVGLVADRTPSILALLGAGCAVAAIGLVSLSGGHSPVTPRLIGLALAAGAMFGVFFSVLGLAGTGHGLWPMVGVRVASVGAGLLVAARTRTSLRLSGGGLRWTLIAGPLDILANVLYVIAAAGGLLSIIAPVASLYPVSTVLLALAVDRERVRPVQLAGLGLAAAALVLVAT